MSHDYRSDKLNFYQWFVKKSASCRVLCTEKIKLREWVHLAVTKKDRKVSFYINGKFINSSLIYKEAIAYSSIGNNGRYIGKVYGKYIFLLIKVVILIFFYIYQMRNYLVGVMILG